MSVYRDKYDSKYSVESEREKTCKVFVSYSHVDEVERMRLEAHLSPLAREGLVDVWCNRAILSGVEWEREIRAKLARVDLFVLLVTADYIASKYCMEVELFQALRRHRTGSLRVLPVLVRPVDFMRMPFGRFQVLPRDLRPINTWGNRDEAWLEVALGIRELVDDIRGVSTRIPAQRSGDSVGGVRRRSIAGHRSNWLRQKRGVR